MNDKKCYISILQCVCSFCVVMLHINASCFNEFNLEGCWSVANFIECGFRFAVPVFLMITGATLIDYTDKYTTKEYFKKRIFKTVIPFLFWGIFVGNLYSSYSGRADTFFIYYFFLYLFGIYLCVPLFSFINKENKEHVFTYLVVISFLLNYLIPFLCKLFETEYVFKIPFEVASNFLIYPLLGYLLCKKDIKWRWRCVFYIFSLIGFIICIGGTYIRSIELGEIDYLFHSYTDLPSLLMAVGVFVFVKEIGGKIKNITIIRAINGIGSYAFAVYLLHWYVVYFIIEQLSNDIHTVSYKVLATIGTYIICIVLSWIIKKIPIVKIILP